MTNGGGLTDPGQNSTNITSALDQPAPFPMLPEITPMPVPVPVEPDAFDPAATSDPDPALTAEGLTDPGQDSIDLP